jgi:hypothetical protein
MKAQDKILAIYFLTLALIIVLSLIVHIDFCSQSKHTVKGCIKHGYTTKIDNPIIKQSERIPQIYIK